MPVSDFWVRAFGKKHHLPLKLTKAKPQATSAVRACLMASDKNIARRGKTTQSFSKNFQKKGKKG